MRCVLADIFLCLVRADEVEVEEEEAEAPPAKAP